MNPAALSAASPAEVRAWISGHLDPLDDHDNPSRQMRSDFDLNPALVGIAHDPPVMAAVLVPLVQREHGLSVILTRRADALRRHSGQVAFPGGRADPGETPPVTALREAHEEIGLHPDLVSLAGLSTPYQTGTGYIVTPVVGFVEPGFSLRPNPQEVADIFETPFGFLMDPSNHEERFHEFPNGERRRFYAMSYEDRLIWGATAGMLRALYDRLYGAALG